MSNLELHCRNLREIYGLTPVVCFNRFPTDTDEEMAAAIDHLQGLGLPRSSRRTGPMAARGALCALAVVEAVVEAAERGRPEDPAASARYSYETSTARWRRRSAPSRSGSTRPSRCRPADQGQAEAAQFTEEGYGDAPVCIAKTQYSLSTDGSLRGAPTDHIIEVKDVRLSAGAGFIVVIAGDIMTMPGLPREPSALKIDVTEDGNITGLF
jgi:formate--tetrahydrofolate ligase